MFEQDTTIKTRFQSFTSTFFPSKRLPRAGAALLLSVLALLLFTTNNAPVTATSASDPFELGGQILGFLHPDEMHAASMTWLKMQITYSQGGSTADAQNVINHARNHNFKVLLSIKGIKSQLAANPTAYYQSFATFLGQVALLNPDAIEVWNEPNIDAEWPAGMISGANYAAMLAKAYPAIKNANANVMVISGAPSPTGFFGGGCAANGCDDLPFITAMKNAGAANNFDCLGMHYNEGVVPPSASSGDPRGNPNHYTRYYPTMVNTYRGVFPTKQLCFTELGYLSPDGLGTLPPGMEWGANTSAQEQADWQAQAAVLSRDGGKVRLMIVWNVDATFIPSNYQAGFAIIRQGGQCLACTTLTTALGKGPKSAPALSAPANTALVKTIPQFSWGTVADSTLYQLYIDNASNFAAPLVRDITQAGTTYTPPSMADGVYYWKVRAKNDDGDGPWSAVRSFTLDTTAPAAPTLLTPEDGSSTSTNPPTFTWAASTGANTYEMRLGTVNPPSNIIASGKILSYKPVSSMLVGTYYWQVRATDQAGNISGWSSVSSFELVSPEEAAPDINYNTVNTTRLTWSPMNGAVAYQVQVANNPAFTGTLEANATLEGASSLTYVTPTLPNGLHYWRVRGRQNNGVWGAWSLVTSFRIAVPG